jgi:hypothetical protein
MNGAGGRAGSAPVAALAFAVLLALAIAAEAGRASILDPLGQVFSATSGDDSERKRLLPIGRKPSARERVLMSLGPAELPTLQGGDELLASAELQVSTTCVDKRSRRCIGRPYRFSPALRTRLELAPTAESTRGQPISDVDSRLCHQRRPNRNHHCVLVVGDARFSVNGPGDLPCAPDECFLNLVASASHRNARPGNVLAVAADTPAGGVRGDRGRVNAVVLRGSGLASDAGRSSELRSTKLPVAATGIGGRRVIYSLPLTNLRAGDAYLATAKQRMQIRHLPYNVFLGARLILAESPDAVVPGEFSRRVGRHAGQITERNGFNCTLGPSGYESPCLSRKAGLLEVAHNSVDQLGRPVTLYLNLVMAAAPKLARARGRHNARPLPEGFIEARRYRR